RIDVLREAYLRVPDGPAEDLRASLVDPAVCKKPVVADIPRLTLVSTQGAIASDVRVWQPVAIAHHRLDLARQLDIQDARARLQLGDVVSAHADLIRLWLARPPTKTIMSRRITGEI